jgi:1,4-dihydroxy-6-naphthoate synthase
MFDALAGGRIDLRGLTFETGFEDIEQLNRRAVAGEADVCKISCAILPLTTDRYALLHGGAALGRGNGPLVVARGEVDLSQPLRVAVPGLHTTANSLMNRLYPHITNKPCLLFSEIADAVARGEVDAGVLIHEGRFTFADRGLRLAADLGAEWERRTGLPLPLGAIVVRRSLLVEVQRTVDELVRESVLYARAHPEASAEFVRTHAQELSQSVTRQHIAMFVNEFSVAVGPEGERAIRELTGLAGERIFVA